VSGRPTLLPVSAPATPGADRDAERQLRESYDAVMAISVRADATADVLGMAYGDLGKLLMAAELYEAAEPGLLNAHALMPGDAQWTYYLAHLYRKRGDLASSAEYFEQTLAVEPGNVAAIWWLGGVYIDQGRWDDAETRFSRALALQPGALSAVYGLGRAALGRGDFARAVEYFERVLAMNRRALAAHYPLGLAYRGLGRIAEAEAHLRQRSHMEIVPIDPRMNELDGLLHSVTAYQDRGMKASLAGNWEEAVVHFRRAAELAPEDPVVRIDLSTSLARAGDAGAALAQAREALRLAPGDRRAQRLVATLSTAARAQN
jgi:tetratricopeptide (TPR) repeat protein